MFTTARLIAPGREFAAALDARDYDRAAAFLAENCRYERPGHEALVGPQAVCDSYRDSDLRARGVFDSVSYCSEAASDASGGVRLTFIDKLSRGKAVHVFRCVQIVYFDDHERIERIVLEELAGERDRLNLFCSAHGIQLI